MIARNVVANYITSILLKHSCAYLYVRILNLSLVK